MSEHTLCPWTIEPFGQQSRLIRAYDPSGEGFPVAYVYQSNDAQVISAAPDMLASLRSLVWQLDRMDDLPDEVEEMVKAARAAVAKAEG